MKKQKTNLRIKNMVCRHCIESVLSVFRQMDLEVSSVRLGEVIVEAAEADIDMSKLKQLLEQNGFEILQDHELQLVEQIKTAVIKMIHHSDNLPEVKNSVYLSNELNLSYAYLSKLFSKHIHLTIEKYIILQKIERVKELLFYEERNLSEIAYSLGYSSVQHLSNQFKSVTGMSVSQFKKLDDKDRQAINELV